MSIWEQCKSFLEQVDKSVVKRQSKWVVTCLDCTSKREVTYAQAWNVAKSNSSGRCQSCAENNKPKLGKYSRGGKEVIQRKLSDVLKYRNMFDNPSKKPEVKEKMRQAKLGKRGEGCSNWQGGLTKGRRLAMQRDDYKQLRKSVFERDSYSCVICAATKELEMDHIKEWCNYPELRYEITNCRTLCHSCHSKTDNYGTKALRKKHGT